MNYKLRIFYRDIIFAPDRVGGKIEIKKLDSKKNVEVAVKRALDKGIRKIIIEAK